MSLLLLFSGSSSVSKSDSDTGSSVDSGAILVSSVDAGSGVDASSLSAVFSVFDVGAFTDALSSLLTQISEVDTALFTEMSSLLAFISGSDTSSGVDVSSLISTTSNDSGSGVDVSSLTSVTSNDSGAGADVVLVVSVTDADTGSGVDSSLLSAVISGSDTGAVVDVLFSFDTQISESDMALFSELSVVLAQVAEVDSFLGVDAGVLFAAISQIDLGSLQDLGSAGSVSVSDSESGVGAELFDLGLFTSDTIASVEGATTVVALSDQDTGQVMDLAAVGVTPLFSWEEYGVESEVELVSVSVTAADSFSAVEDAVVSVSSLDFCSLLEDAGSSTSVSDADLSSSVENSSLVAQLTSVDSVVVVESFSLLVSITGFDSCSGIDFEALGSPVFGVDSVTTSEAWFLSVSQGSVDTASGNDVAAVSVVSPDAASGVDTEVLVVSVSVSDTATSSESQLVAQLLSSVDIGLCSEDAIAAVSALGSDSANFVDSGLVVVPVSDADSAVFYESGVASLPIAPVSVLDDLSPSVVEVLRMVSTRTNGSLSVSWVPISELTAPSFSAIRPRTVWNHPTVGGQLVVRFDLQFVRPGAMQLPPPQQGTMPDRVGVLFADPSAAEWLRAGDRVRCLSGPIDGTFEIRVTPDLALGYGSAHHLEVEVVEVNQAPTGTHAPADFDYQLYPSYIRSLYATRAEVLRLSLSSPSAGSAQSSWTKVMDMVDPLLGTPGELLCRINTSFLRPGKDQPVPIVAGRAPDRVGVLYADLTPFLKAGDRVHCLEGDVYGTFELRVTPDLAPNVMSIGHLEVQVIEVSQSLATYGH